MHAESEPADVICDLIRKGNYLQAIDVAGSTLEKTEAPLIRKNLALALSRMGYADQAMETLKPLMRGDDGDAETQALMGGILKRQWELTGDDDLLRKSYEHYLSAFREDRGYWAGINAATLASVMGMDTALPIADEVLDICWDEYSRMGTRSSFWLLVSIAEAHLVKGDARTAEKWYRLVTPMAYRSAGHMKTVRRNARILAKNLVKEDCDSFLESIHSPRIGFFAGHRIDRAGRPPRFPQRETESVKAKLRSVLGSMKISVGIASLADGADILFHECLQESGRQSRVVLPFPVSDYRGLLEKDDPGGWLPRFDRIIQQASDVEVLSQSCVNETCGDVYDLTADYMIGAAMDLADEFDGEMVPLVVWDGKQKDRAGGTYSTVKKLRYRGFEPEVIQVFSETAYEEESSSNELNKGVAMPAPFRTSIVVIGTGRDQVDQPGRFSQLEELMRHTRTIIKAGNLTPLRKSMGYQEIYVIFRDVSDSHKFAQEFSRRECTGSLLVHGGFSYEMKDGVSAGNHFYSPALTEAVVISEKLSSKDTFCSVTHRSLARFEGCTGFRFVYSGRFSTGGQRELGLFRMIPE
jgi:hypothetical protein